MLKAKKSKRIDRIKKCIEKGQIKVIKSSEKDIEYAESLPTALGLGERYAIAIGISEKCLIVTDDLKPRKIAKELGLDVIGTLGILKLTCERNLIGRNELRQSVEMLHEVLYFTDYLEEWVLSDDTT